MSSGLWVSLLPRIEFLYREWLHSYCFETQGKVLQFSDWKPLLAIGNVKYWLPRLRSHPGVTSDHPKSNAHGVFPDHNYRVCDLVPDGNGLIRGRFRMRMVWSGVSFGVGMVWSEVASRWEWYDQRGLSDGNSLIRGLFWMVTVWS